MKLAYVDMKYRAMGVVSLSVAGGGFAGSPLTGVAGVVHTGHAKCQCYGTPMIISLI